MRFFLRCSFWCVVFFLLHIGSNSLSTVEASSSNFTFESETIITICDIYRINVTKKGEPIPQCEGLPSGEDFFNVAKRHLWEAKCDETSNDEPLARRPTIWDRSIRALHWLLEGVQNKIKALGVVLLRAVEDVSRMSLITRRWNVYWYFVAALGASLVFFVQGLLGISRPGKLSYNIALNAVLGLASTVAYYMIHLYFRNIYVMVFFVIFGLFGLSPWYCKSKLPGLGIITSVELLVPCIGFIVMKIFDTQLFFGPVLSLYINGGSIVIHILCLIALYIDEKLILVKVFLLPFYRMFQKVFNMNSRNQQEIDFMAANMVRLNNEIFSTFGEAPPPPMSTIEQLDRAFTAALTTACKNRQGQWKDQCWYFIRDACKDETWNLGALPYMIGWVLCPKVAYESCDPVGKIDMDKFCAAPEMSAFGAAHHGYSEALERLRREIIIDPLKPKVNSDFLEMTAGFDLFAAKWTWWVRHIISWSLAGLFIAVLLLSVIYAINFLLKYRSNPYFNNDYLSSSVIDRFKIKLSRREKRKYYTSFSTFMYEYVYTMYRNPMMFYEGLRLLGSVMLCFWLEQFAKFLHQQLMNIQFVVPEYGEARFVFNVQGTGAIATIMRTVLGGFSLQSKYCKVADSSVCDTAFVPVRWQTWAMLFGLAIFYFLVNVFRSKSDYIQCRLCDFLIPEQGQKRAEVTLEDVLEERRKRSTIINQVAKDELDEPCFDHEQNELVLSFYLPRRFYHRFLPTIYLSLIARIFYGIDNIRCQVCNQTIISGRFRCRTLLFCDECRLYLRECPCGGDLCRDGIKFDV